MTSVLQKWSARFPDFGAVIARFPVAVAIMACVTLYLIFIGLDGRNEAANFAIIGLTLSAYFAVMQSIWAQAREKIPNWIIQITLAILTASLFYFSDKLHVNVSMICLATLLLLGNSVRFGRERDDLHVWDFTHKIWTTTAFTGLGCAIYLIGVMAIFYALKSLFGFDLEDILEQLLLPIGLAFLAPLHWLSNIPTADEPYDYLNASPSFVSRSVAFLGTWILAPLTLIYALILLACGLKIFMQSALPNGEIAELTIPFLLIGTLTWLLLEPPFIKKNGLARVFRRFWFIVSIPAAILLAISIYVRIAQYGLTTERIILSLACFWSLALSSWFTFTSKLRRDIRLIPALAAILFLIAAPFAHHLSVGSQFTRFENSLEVMKTAKQGDLKPAATTKGALKYLWQNNAKDKVRMKLTRAGYDISKTSKLDDIYMMLDLKSIRTPRKFGNDNVIMREENYNYETESKSVRVAGYDYIFGEYYHSLNGNAKFTTLELDDVNLKIDTGVLSVTADDNELSQFDLDKWMMSLRLEGEVIYGAQEPQRLYQDQDRELVIVVHSMNLQVRNDDKDKITGNMRFYILAKGFDPE